MKFNPKFQLNWQIIGYLLEIEGCSGFIKAHRLNHPEKIDLEPICNIPSQISNIDPSNEKQILSYRKAYQYLTDFFLVERPITQEVIFAMHQKLFNGAILDPDSLGKYRKSQNYIYDFEKKKILYTPPPPIKITEEIRDLLQWFHEESTIHPLIKIGIFRFQFFNIHPFSDGNGRVCQLLSMVMLYQAGYEFKDYFVVGEIYLKDRNNHHNSIQFSRQKGEGTLAVEYFLQALSKQMREVRRILEWSYKTKVEGKKIDDLKPLAGRFITKLPTTLNKI